jgi:hypothetical protein
VGWLKRTVPGNTRVVTAVVADPDRWAIQAASLGLATGTFSPMSAGRHTSGTARGYTGDRGFGVNRWSGRTTYPLQAFRTAVGPVADPRSKRVGAGAMASGQPGLPSTGDAQYPGLGSLALMSMNPLLRQGMGG